jgi:hypothetical protein
MDLRLELGPGELLGGEGGLIIDGDTDREGQPV